MQTNPIGNPFICETSFCWCCCIKINRHTCLPPYLTAASFSHPTKYRILAMSEFLSVRSYAPTTMKDSELTVCPLYTQILEILSISTLFFYTSPMQPPHLFGGRKFSLVVPYFCERERQVFSVRESLHSNVHCRISTVTFLFTN